MSLQPLKVAVVGHTNTGKTSLLRTLTRETGFGEVSNRPATTRHVEGAAIMVNGQPLIELYDTPGLEDSISLLERLELLRGGQRMDGPDQIAAFLGSPDAHGRFSQEAKAIRQVMNSDLALYVIDARDRVLGKHRDELEILARCARPVVPLLNFTASDQAQTQVWREHLSRVNMHAVAEFDTVVLDEHSERRLLEKMRTLLDGHSRTIDALIAERQAQRERLIRASAGLLADLLIDAAACHVQAPLSEPDAAKRTVEQLRQAVRDREQRFVERLLELHRFGAHDAAPGELPLVDGRWGIDLFSPAAMKQFSVRAGGGAVAGALTGLTIDAMTAGMSLGAATALGAAIGATLGAGQAHARRLFDRMRGRVDVRCDDGTLRLLTARGVYLAQALLRRGHASVQPVQVSSGAGQLAVLPAGWRLPDEVDEARLRPAWSRPERGAFTAGSASRGAAQDRLAAKLVPLIVAAAASK